MRSCLFVELEEGVEGVTLINKWTSKRACLSENGYYWIVWGHGWWLSRDPLPSDSIFFGRKYLSIVDLFETNSWDPDLNKVGLMWGRSHKIKKDL